MAVHGAAESSAVTIGGALDCHQRAALADVVCKILDLLRGRVAEWLPIVGEKNDRPILGQRCCSELRSVDDIRGV